MLYDRLRAVACRYWGIAPPVLDGMISRGEIAMKDVSELVRMLAHDPLTGIWIGKYLVPEVEERQKKKTRRLNSVNSFGLMLNAMGPKPKNEAEAKFLEALKKQAVEAAKAEQEKR